jgi:hypothetical protein
MCLIISFSSLSGINDKWQFQIVNSEVFGTGGISCSVLKLSADRGIGWEIIQSTAMIESEGVLVLKEKMHIMTKGPEICLLQEKHVTETDGIKIINSYNKYTPWNCEPVSAVVNFLSG